MKFEVSDPFNQEITNYSSNTQNTDSQQTYNEDYYQRLKQNYGNDYQIPKNQSKYYNNTGFQDPMTDGRFHRPDFDNKPYNRTDFYADEIRKRRETMQKSSSDPYAKLKSILFLLWFVGSIIGMLITATSANGGWTLILFGQAFGIMGTIAFFKQKHKLENLLLLIFPLAGFGLIIGGLISLYGSDALIEKIMQYIPHAFYIVLFLIGIGMLFYTPFVEKKIRERCTVPVRAIVVDLLERRGSKGSRTYAPVYEYYYNGKTHRQCDNTSTNFSLPSVGDEMEGYVNPEDSNDLFVVWKGRNILNKVFAWIFIIFAALVLLAFFIPYM